MPTGYDSTQAREQSLLVQLELLERDPEQAVVTNVIGAIRHGGRLLAIQGGCPASAIVLLRAVKMRRETSRVSFLVSPFCVGAELFG